MSNIIKSIAEIGVKGLLAFVATVGLVAGGLYLIYRGEYGVGVGLLSPAGMLALNSYFSQKKDTESK